MVGGALVGFRAGMDISSLGRWLYQIHARYIFGMPDTSVSRYARFRHFPVAQSLDKVVSGIPNAKKSTPGCSRGSGSHIAVADEHLATFTTMKMTRDGKPRRGPVRAFRS